MEPFCTIIISTIISALLEYKWVDWGLESIRLVLHDTILPLTREGQIKLNWLMMH